MVACCYHCSVWLMARGRFTRDAKSTAYSRKCHVALPFLGYATLNIEIFSVPYSLSTNQLSRKLEEHATRLLC
jgi:hypothetical protein